MPTAHLRPAPAPVLGLLGHPLTDMPTHLDAHQLTWPMATLRSSLWAVGTIHAPTCNAMCSNRLSLTFDFRPQHQLDTAGINDILVSFRPHHVPMLARVNGPRTRLRLDSLSVISQGTMRTIPKSAEPLLVQYIKMLWS